MAGDVSFDNHASAGSNRAPPSPAGLAWANRPLIAPGTLPVSQVKAIQAELETVRGRGFN